MTELGKMAARLARVEDAVWDRYQLRKEPLEGRLTPEQRVRFSDLAHRTGIDLARRVRADHPGISVRELLSMYHVRLETPDAPDQGVYHMFASFTEPDLVTLYESTALEAQQALTDTGALPGGTPLTEVLLAHELFHVLAYQTPLPTDEKLLELWKLGPLRVRSRVMVLSEMAAMVFARELLKLPYSPNALDVILLYPQDPPAARRIYESIVALEGSAPGAEGADAL